MNNQILDEITVYYVEDDEDDQYIFKKTLRAVAPKAELTIFRNGSELIEALENPPVAPSIIFIDLNLPGITGHDVMRLIRKNPLYSLLPLVVLSTSGAAWSIEESKRNGANFYVVKSPNLETYKQSLYIALANNSGVLKDEEKFVFNGDDSH